MVTNQPPRELRQQVTLTNGKKQDRCDEVCLRVFVDWQKHGGVGHGAFHARAAAPNDWTRRGGRRSLDAATGVCSKFLIKSWGIKSLHSR